MLYVHLGEFTDDCIVDINGHFKFFKKKEWFNDPFIRKVIKGIDNSEVIKDEYIESPVFGGMSPERLSTGCKAVILMKYEPDYKVYATRCGDNCFPYVQELAKLQDVHILLHNCPFMPEDINAVFIDSGIEVNNREGFIDEYYRIRRQISRL